jgi:hypothetical protein
MLWALTPRLEVLAELTGLGPELLEAPPDDVAELEALEPLDGAVPTQATTATSTATTTATVRI